MLKEEKIREKIVEFLEDFQGKGSNRGKVKDIRYDSWPIWWFFKFRFFMDRLLFPLPSHREIINSIMKNKKKGFKEKFQDKLIIFTLKKFLEFNERSKLLISKFSKRKKRGKKGEEKRIMFLIHTNAIILENENEFTVDRINSVVKEVRKSPEFEEYISIIDPLSHNSLLKLLRYENLVYSYIDKKIKEKAKRESFNLHKKWKKISEEVNYDSGLEKDIWTFLKPSLELFFSQEFIYLIILYYETYKKIIREEKIRVLCCYADLGVISKCAIAAAHKLGIKSLYISHGLGMPIFNPDQPPSLYHAVIGARYKEEFVSLGVNPKNIFVTGPVFMDYIIPYIKKKKIKSGKKNITLVTQALVEDNFIEKKVYFNYIKKFLSELKKIPNVDIKIKLHPRERYLGEYGRIIKSLNSGNIEIVKSQKKEQLYNLIKESDLVIGFASTVLVEAMIINTPILIIDLIENTDPILRNRNKIIHLKPKESIYTTCKKILYNKNFKENIIKNEKKLIKKYLYKVDGKTGERITKIIKKLS